MSRRCLGTIVLLLVTALLCSSCATMRALAIRSEAEKLYQEGRTSEIIPLLENALPELRQQFGPDHDYVAECLNGLGMTYGWVANDFVRSEDYFLQALAIRERTRGPEDTATLETRRYLGLLYQVAGNYVEAEEIFDDVLAILIRTKGVDHPDTAETMIMLGQLYFIRGDYGKAEDLFKEASRHETPKVSAKYPSPADALSLLGALYMVLGDLDQSESYLHQALAIRQAAFKADHSMLALSYESLGNLAVARKQYDTAIAHFTEAMRIKKKIFGERHGFIGDSYMTFGIVYLHQGDMEQAAQQVARAGDIYREMLGPESPHYLMSQFARGLFYLKANEMEQAKALYQELLATAGLDNVKELLWCTRFMYSLCLAATGQHEAAIFFGKQAVNTIQELRTEVANISGGLQKQYLPTRENAYKTLAGMLIEKGRIPEAQQVLSMLKEEEYFQYIRRDLNRLERHTLRAAYTVVEEDWSGRYQEIHQQLVSLGRELEGLRQKKRGGLSAAQSARMVAIREDLKLARTVYRRFLQTLEQELAQMSHERVKEISAKNLDALKAMQGVLREMEGEAVLVHYLVTEELLYIILTTDQVQIVRKVEIGAAELNGKIMAFRQQLENPQVSPLPGGKELYDILIRPIGGDLAQTDSRVLMLAMDGALRYLPAAALYDGTAYLAERYGIVLFTEAAKARLLSRTDGALRLAGLGLTHEVEGFSPLPAVRQELESIVLQDDADREGILPGEIHLDEAFTGEKMVDVLDRDFSVLHIASHFVFRPGTESDSYLLLGDGSRLSLSAISEEDMDFNDVELLTLSACDTAMGGPAKDGKEIEGFGSLAQRQGAKTVIATLWPVADVSTGAFMVDFYRHVQDGRLSKALALQQAQKNFIHSPNYHHPFFWAPFLLMGNWL